MLLLRCKLPALPVGIHKDHGDSLAAAAHAIISEGMAHSCRQAGFAQRVHRVADSFTVAHLLLICSPETVDEKSFQKQMDVSEFARIRIMEDLLDFIQIQKAKIS